MQTTQIVAQRSDLFMAESRRKRQEFARGTVYSVEKPDHGACRKTSLFLCNSGRSVFINSLRYRSHAVYIRIIPTLNYIGVSCPAYNKLDHPGITKVTKSMNKASTAQSNLGTAASQSLH